MSVYEGHGVTLHHADCLDVLRSLPDCSVDPEGASTPLRRLAPQSDTSGKGDGSMVASPDHLVQPIRGIS